MKKSKKTKALPTACKYCKYRKRGLTRLFSSAYRCSISTRDAKTSMQLSILPDTSFLHPKCPLTHPRHLDKKFWKTY